MTRFFLFIVALLLSHYTVSTYGYYAPNDYRWMGVPTDSVQAQGARALALASNNAAVFNTINANNYDLFVGPQLNMAMERSIDFATASIFGGAPPGAISTPYGFGHGFGYDYGFGHGYGHGYNGYGFFPGGSAGAAWSASNQLQLGLANYLGSNSYIGTSASIYDETWRTHQQFTRALSNTAAQQRASHEMAYASAGLGSVF